MTLTIIWISRNEAEEFAYLIVLGCIKGIQLAKMDYYRISAVPECQIKHFIYVIVLFLISFNNLILD